MKRLPPGLDETERRRAWAQQALDDLVQDHAIGHYSKNKDAEIKLVEHLKAFLDPSASSRADRSEAVKLLDRFKLYDEAAARRRDGKVELQRAEGETHETCSAARSSNLQHGQP
jgi:hypothetical protein